MRSSLILILLILPVLLFSCASVEQQRAETSRPAVADGRSPGDADAPTQVRERLVENALDILGADELIIEGKRFRIDCTGVVQGIYHGAGIDLVTPLGAYSGNGVVRLYSYLDDEGLLSNGREPQPGDLVFWDNTYDKNGSGKPDDPLTHVGMIVSVADNGDMQYIHHNYARGIVLESMNLRDPSRYSRVEDGETVIVNSFMRASGAPDYDKRLAGELVNALGQAYYLIE